MLLFRLFLSCLIPAFTYAAGGFTESLMNGIWIWFPFSDSPSKLENDFWISKINSATTFISGNLNSLDYIAKNMEASGRNPELFYSIFKQKILYLISHREIEREIAAVNYAHPILKRIISENKP